MTKILIITESIPGININGVSSTLLQTKLELEKLHYRVQFITPLDKGFISLPCPTDKLVRLVLNPWKVGRMIDQSFATYIHIATEGPLAYAAVRYCEKNGLHFTTSYHTKLDEYIPARFPFIKAAWITRYLKRLHKSSKAVLVTTPSMKNELASQGYSNLKVWGRGVDSLFNSTYRLPHSQVTLLYVGRIAVEKNIEAFLTLDLPYKKVVVGDGPLLNHYKAKYPLVEFKGELRGIELATAYANSDVFVFPSLTDTFGLVNLESIACATPVAAYEGASGVKDIIINGVTGCLDCDLGHAVEVCLKLDRQLVEAQARQYTWEACTKIFLKSLITI